MFSDIPEQLLSETQKVPKVWKKTKKPWERKWIGQRGGGWLPEQGIYLLHQQQKYHL